MMRLLLLSACCHGVLAFSSSTIRTAFANSGKHVNNNIKNNNINFGPSPTGLHATTTKTVVFDGPEWSSIQQAMPDRTTPTTLNSCGVMTVAVGTFEGERMVGVVAEQDSSDATVTLDNNSRVYQHTLAKLPAKIPDQDALTTVVAALVGIQCTAPRLDSVGGSSQSECWVSGRVVVLGGSDYAAFCAEGLAACGAHVYWVSTNNVNIQHPNGTSVEYCILYVLVFFYDTA